MTHIISITIPEEIARKLKGEDNKSGLIATLLEQFYEKQKRLKDGDLTLEEIKQEKQKYLQEHQDSETALKEFEELEKQITETEEEKKKREEKRKNERLLVFEDNVRTFCDVEGSEVKKIAELYEEEKSIFQSFFDWCEAKKIPFKKRVS